MRGHMALSVAQTSESVLLRREPTRWALGVVHLTFFRQRRIGGTSAGSRIHSLLRAESLTVIVSEVLKLWRHPWAPSAPGRWFCYTRAYSRMGYPLDLARRYLGSRHRGFISVSTACAIIGVSLGVAALVTVMSATGGLLAQFREKVLGVNAHLLVMKYSPTLPDFGDVMAQVESTPGVLGASRFTIAPMMLSRNGRAVTGVLVKGIDPRRALGVGAEPGRIPVLDLPRHVVEGTLDDLVSSEPTPPAPVTSGWASTSAPPPVASSSSVPNLLEAIRREVEEKSTKLTAPIKTPLPTANALDLPAGAPQGGIEPEGGYGSVLPDEDDLPRDVDPDPCGDPARVRKLPALVVGRTLARNLGVSLGSCITVTSPTIGFSYSGGSLRAPVAKPFRVAAIFEAGFEQYDAKLAYVDLLETQAFYNHGDTATGIEMKVDNIDNARAIGQAIAEKLPDGQYQITDWEQLNHGLFMALRVQQILMSSVLGLIIVVAAFTVIATLIMVVLDKKREVCVLKAMGARPQEIMRIFLYQGTMIGLLGTGLGLVLGFATCKLIHGFPLDPKVYFVNRLPVHVRPFEFLVTGGVAMAITLVSALFPSLYASRLPPTAAFREE